LQQRQGTTRTINREGPQNPLETGIALQAPSQSTNIAGIQNLVETGIALQAPIQSTNTAGIQNPTTAAANSVQGLATSGTTGGTQNFSGIASTGQNAPTAASTHGPSQTWTPGQPFPGYPWMQGQAAFPYPAMPNQWYPPYQGFHPTPQGLTPQPHQPAPLQAESPPRTSRASRTRSPSPTQDKEPSAKVMLKNALREMIAEEFGEATVSTNITTNGKSAKILNGVNQYSLKAYSGRKINEDVPEIFRVLDSNENMTTKVQALEDRLSKAQSANAMVKFTLRC